MPVPSPEHPSAWSCCVADIFLVHRPEPAQPLIVSSFFIPALVFIHPALSFRLLCLPVEGNKACLYDYQWILVRYHSSWYSWSEHRFPPKRTSLHSECVACQDICKRVLCMMMRASADGWLICRSPAQLMESIGRPHHSTGS